MSPIDFLPGFLIDALISDWGEVTIVEHVQRQRIVLGGSVKLDGHVNQSEGNSAFPQSSWHLSSPGGYRLRAARTLALVSSIRTDESCIRKSAATPPPI